MNGFFFALCGSAVGLVQAGFLARTARRGPHILGVLVRLVLVAGVLFVAARAGHLLSGVAGWIAGFAVALAIAYRRWR